MYIDMYVCVCVCVFVKAFQFYLISLDSLAKSYRSMLDIVFA
jgi:hypothetical protein